MAKIERERFQRWVARKNSEIDDLKTLDQNLIAHFESHSDEAIKAARRLLSQELQKRIRIIYDEIVYKRHMLGMK